MGLGVREWGVGSGEWGVGSGEQGVSRPCSLFPVISAAR